MVSRATGYSVVIPAFNAAATIAEAVRSVLSQSVAPRAVVIVDDGSTDATAEIVAALPGPVRLVRQAKHGPAPLLLRGRSATMQGSLALTWRRAQVLEAAPDDPAALVG